MEERDLHHQVTGVFFTIKTQKNKKLVHSCKSKLSIDSFFFVLMGQVGK